jgi:hypothetical protein
MVSMTTMPEGRQGRADLHVHTTWSDGAQRPEAVAIEVVNNAGVFSWLYDAWAALRNTEWMLPVCGGSDAHHVWYIGNGVTRFEGRDAAALRRALAAGRTRAHRACAWTADKLPRHVHYQSRSLIKFLRLSTQRRAL